MIAVDKMTDAEFEAAAFDVLQREVGADGLARFIRLRRFVGGGYMAERDSRQTGVSIDDIAESFRLKRAPKP